jgi:hypothetical protein
MSAEALATLVGICRKHTAAIDADLLARKSAGLGATQWLAFEGLRRHLDAIDNAMAAALTAALLAQPMDGLDAAWAAAESALPEGWRLALKGHPLAEDPTQRYEGVARPIYSDWASADTIRVWCGDGVGALLALRALLDRRASTGVSE